LFKQVDKASSSPTANDISLSFWSGYSAYSVEWKFNTENNNYIRYNGGEEQIDFNVSKPITAKNIIVQFVKETRSVDEHLHNLYAVIGKGTGVLIQNGQKTEVTWSKANRASRTIYKDENGKEINFVAGNIWVEILPIGTEISYN
jgi:hypothetical protein